MLSEFSLVPLAELILNFQELVIDSAEKLLSLVSCDLHVLGNGLMPCLIMLWFAGRIGEEAMLDSWNISFLQSCVIDGNSFYSYILMSSGHFPVKSWRCFGSSENKKRDFGPFFAVKKNLWSSVYQKYHNFVSLIVLDQGSTRLAWNYLGNGNFESFLNPLLRMHDLNSSTRYSGNCHLSSKLSRSSCFIQPLELPIIQFSSGDPFL